MSEQRKMKKYEELCYRDDFMFGKVMSDPDLCRVVLECLLQRPVSELKEVQTQREIKFVADGKPIRLDVYNVDTEGNVYDAEMENLNHRSVESHQLPKRSRYYQASIDTDYMDEGDSYRKLPDSNVMFICTFDPFGLGLSQYTFYETCEEDHELKLNDGTIKIFYNCTYVGEDIPENLREFYDYVENGKAGSELTKRIDEAVLKSRKNSIWRSQYMKEKIVLQDAREEGFEEGVERGIEQGIEQGIRNMLSRGKSVEEIVDFCGYSVELVKKVEESMLATSN